MAGPQPARARPKRGIELLRDGLAAWRKTGARLWLPIFLALEAEAHAKAGRSDTALQVIEEALLISEETGERWADRRSSAHQGRPAPGRRPPGRGSRSFARREPQIARHQQARSWELRTACDLARLWQHQGRGAEALQLVQTILRPIHGRLRYRGPPGRQSTAGRAEVDGERAGDRESNGPVFGGDTRRSSGGGTRS